MSEARRYPATIADAVEHESVLKKSRFLTHAHPVTTPEEAETIIAATRKRFWDANHNCVALVTGLDGDHSRSSDDGEPSGTAGAPMLDVLLRRGMTDVLVIVTRYFGGVKLGAGGLVRAYSGAVSDVLDRAVLVRRELFRQATLAVPHSEAGRYAHLLHDWAQRHDAAMDDIAYDTAARFTLWVPPASADALIAEIATASAGGLAVTWGRDEVRDVR